MDSGAVSMKKPLLNPLDVANLEAHVPSAAALGLEDEDGEGEPFSLWTKNNLIVVCIGMALAVDYSLVMVSIPNYWANVSPNALNQMGLVVGLYDLSQFLFAPLFGWLADRFGLKRAFCASLGVNILGNAIYSCGIVVGGYRGTNVNGIAVFGTAWMLAVGRFVGGIGSGALALSAVYFTITTSIADRQKASIAQQAPLVTARSLGPTAGCMLIVFTPQFLSHTDKFQQTFNFLTEAGWLCVGLSSMALVLTAVAFDDPPKSVLLRAKRSVVPRDLGAGHTGFRDGDDDGGRASTPFSPGPLTKSKRHMKTVSAADARAAGLEPEAGSCEALATAWPALLELRGLLVLYFLNVYARMGMLSCYVYLAVAQYQLVEAAIMLWAPWMGVAAGSIIGVKLLEKCVAKGVSDDRVVVWSQAPMLLGSIMLVNWRPHTGADGPALFDWVEFYLGSGLVLISTMLYMPNMESFYTKQVSRLAGQGKGAGAEGFLTAAYTATGALGRFAGPLITVYILRVTLSADPERFLSQCAGPPPNTTNATALQDWSAGCKIDIARAMGQQGGEYVKRLPNTTYCPMPPPANASPQQAINAAMHKCESLDGLCFPFVFPQRFFTGGCSVTNVNWFLPLVGVACALMAVYFEKVFLPRHQDMQM